MTLIAFRGYSETVHLLRPGGLPGVPPYSFCGRVRFSEARGARVTHEPVTREPCRRFAALHLGPESVPV